MNSKVFHRNNKILMPVAISANGVYITDHSGNQYIDASSGASISCVGHNNKEIIEAIQEQLNELEFVHSSFFSNKSAENLAEFIIENSPKNFGAVYFVSGGSEANEAALKLARQFFIEKGEEKKCFFIAREQSYHGATLGALSVTDNNYRRSYFENMLPKNTFFIPPCYPYRHKKTDETEEEYEYRITNELEKAILSIGEDKVAGFIAETISGSTLGAVEPTKNYFKRIREICNRYNILLILDEVMCGCGRSGSFYAFEREKIVPDIVTLAKGLGGGYQPIGAMVLSEEIYQTIKNSSDLFRHGHSYNNHPVACAAALATQKYIKNCNLLEKVNDKGNELKLALKNLLEECEYIGDIRGRGLLLAIELVSEKQTKIPFNVEKKLHLKLKKIGLNNGLLCYPMSGCVDGTEGTHILIAPPYTIESKHCDEIANKLKKTIFESIASLNSK